MKNRFYLKKGVGFQNVFSLKKSSRILVLSLSALFFISTLSQPAEAGKFRRKSEKEKLAAFPDFPEKGIWLNSKPVDKKFFKDKLTLIYVWDYTSINCIREFKILKAWVEHYKPYGFQILWIHAPEFLMGHDPKGVQATVKRYELPGPVFLDNDFKVWDKLGIKSWPSKVLVDEKGKIIKKVTGEGRYSDAEASIRTALKGLDPNAVLPPALHKENFEAYNSDLCGEMSGETYLGFKKSTQWGGKVINKDYLPPNETMTFVDRGERSKRGFFAEGVWTNKEEFLEHARDTGTLYDYTGMVYQGREVYAVLQSTNPRQNARVYVTRDNRPVPEGYRGLDIKVDEKGETYLIPAEARLYYLIEGEDTDYHEVKLWTASKNIAISSFSFSNLCLADFEHR